MFIRPSAPPILLVFLFFGVASFAQAQEYPLQLDPVYLDESSKRVDPDEFYAPYHEAYSRKYAPLIEEQDRKYSDKEQEELWEGLEAAREEWRDAGIVTETVTYDEAPIVKKRIERVRGKAVGMYFYPDQPLLRTYFPQLEYTPVTKITFAKLYPEKVGYYDITEPEAIAAIIKCLNTHTYWRDNPEVTYGKVRLDDTWHYMTFKSSRVDVFVWRGLRFTLENGQQYDLDGDIIDNDLGGRPIWGGGGSNQYLASLLYDVISDIEPTPPE